MSFLNGFYTTVFSFIFTTSAFAIDLHYVQIEAKTKIERTAISNLGVSIDRVMSDSVYGTASTKVLQRLRSMDAPIVETFKIKSTSIVGTEDFPSGDDRFHNYPELETRLKELVSAHSDIAKLFSIGKTYQVRPGTNEKRDIWCVQINTSKDALFADSDNTFSAKPGVVFMGNHHAREHLSAEIPLMLLEFLLDQYGKDSQITDLISKRDIYIIPMVNPDGVEFDIGTGKYQWHRKNMRDNKDGNMGVDLNRNYGFKWGTGGSSTDTSSEVYMGPAPFSEPETQAIRNFIYAHPNINTLLSYHTFSELILYPWGHTYDKVADLQDRATYEAMAKQMSKWNGYTPQQSSALYIASGDTVDWAYGDRSYNKQKIFAFTFELSPKDMWKGGFYPGAKIIDYVFQANLKPALYMIELADNPHRAVSGLRRDITMSWLAPKFSTALE